MAAYYYYDPTNGIGEYRDVALQAPASPVSTQGTNNQTDWTLTVDVSAILTYDFFVGAKLGDG